VRFKHFLLTKFNLGLYPSRDYMARTDKRGLKPADDAERWMEHRLRIFEEYCIPSVMNQSNKDFIWLVVFDKNTPDKYRERIDRYSKDCGVVPLYPTLDFPETSRGDIPEKVDGAWLIWHYRVALPTVQDYIAQQLDSDTEFVITSRLDNDDAIHSDFVGRVQDFVPAEKPTKPKTLIRLIHKWTLDRPPKPTSFVNRQIYKVIHGLADRILPENARNQDRFAVNFTWGYALEGQRVGLFANERNSFVSLIEKRNQAGGLLTVWVTEHRKVNRLARVMEIDTTPLWVRVVHERNLLNQFRGEKIPLSKLSATDFGLSPQTIARA